MINNEQHPLAWALLLTELEDTGEHLTHLIDQMSSNSRIDLEDYRVTVRHIYQHLNRAWNARNCLDTINESEWWIHSMFPEDLELMHDGS